MPVNTVLLTGATGFVGAHAAEAFALHGVALRALVRPTSDSARLRELGATVVVGQLHDIDAVQRAAAGVDAVVHMAALTKARSAAAYDAANEHGTRALLQALAAMPVRPRRFVYLSSLAAVGPSAGRPPVDATSTPQPLSAYGRSKLAGERACARAGDAFEVVVLRAPAVYGPGDRELLPFFRLARLGILPVPGDARRPLQLIHVKDLADALVRAATIPGVRGVYHAAEPRVYTWSDVVDAVARAVGARGRRIAVPAVALQSAAALSELAAGLFGRATMFNRDKARELLAPGWLCDTGRAVHDLGIEPRPLAEGLDDTARWYRQHGWL